ncbi:MAG: QueT transporter family protein [Lachnospiraceae bacterium]|nr:QueT transporter family protein [Lachnospiraceae bacterium]
MYSNREKIVHIAQAGIIAAIYVVLTLMAASFNLANGVIQVRISEALTVLPYFTPAAIPGLIIGCFISNIITGCVVLDIIFGTIATAVAALGSYVLRKNRYLCSIPPVISNMLIVPFVLKYAYGMTDAVWFMALTVGAGEIISCVIIGQILITALTPLKKVLF